MEVLSARAISQSFEALTRLAARSYFWTCLKVRPMESALADAKSTLGGDPSAADLNSARERLATVSHKLAEAMYKAASAGAAPEGAAASEPGTGTQEQKKDEGVIDAEYVDVDK